MAFVPGRVSTALEDGNEERPWPPLFSGPSRKSSPSLLSPWFLSTLCDHPACDPVFLFQACDPNSSLQTLQCATTLLLLGGGDGDLTALCRAPPCWAWSPDCTAAVHGLWQHGAESPLLGSRTAAGFPTLNLGNSVALRHPRSFCDPRES